MSEHQSSDGRWICGIDPGFSGGITFVQPSSDSVVSYPMPVIGHMAKWKRLDSGFITELFQTYRPALVCIEKVAARPGQGVTSMFNFGYNAGILEGIVGALKLQLHFVTPQKWMNRILVGIPKSDDKGSILFASQRYPHIDWRGTERSRIPHVGKTDSLCIALYGVAEHASITQALT